LENREKLRAWRTFPSQQAAAENEENKESHFVNQIMAFVIVFFIYNEVITKHNKARFWVAEFGNLVSFYDYWFCFIVYSSLALVLYALLACLAACCCAIQEKFANENDDDGNFRGHEMNSIRDGITQTISRHDDEIRQQQAAVVVAVKKSTNHHWPLVVLIHSSGCFS